MEKTSLMVIILVLSVILSVVVTTSVVTYLNSDELAEKKSQTELRERLYEWEQRTLDHGGVDERAWDIGQMRKDCVHAETLGYLEWCKSKGLR